MADSGQVGSWRGREESGGGGGRKKQGCVKD